MAALPAGLDEIAFQHEIGEQPVRQQLCPALRTDWRGH
jgi:hypothetical protein